MFGQSNVSLQVFGILLWEILTSDLSNCYLSQECTPRCCYESKSNGSWNLYHLHSDTNGNSLHRRYKTSNCSKTHDMDMEAYIKCASVKNDKSYMRKFINMLPESTKDNYVTPNLGERKQQSRLT